MTEYERKVEEVAKIFFYEGLEEHYTVRQLDNIIDQILSLVEIKSDDQRLPAYTRAIFNQNPQELLAQARGDMLNPDAEGNYWIRVIPKPKRK